MQVSKRLKEKLRPDKIKSALCLELDISRSTLNRWLSKENDKIANLIVIDAINKITGLTQEEIFEKKQK
ncbi:hypothetical protein D1Z98_05140 [Riemerella anatipestifer]|uniref:hypothetical protein n=1 Tax=Riemerella anatipestifer TaxID=34085 RepID=UPI00129E5CC8|nr:hypothetical protein [Riemerella anatipestifer]MRM94378.1 hypothetical protein [Riemerella anatipestifer]